MIGIIGALEHEIRLLSASLENRRCQRIGPTEYFTGTLSGQPVTVAVCGVGKVAAAICCQTMLQTFHPSLVINTGVAGSLSAALHQGDVVVGTQVVQHDMDIAALGFAPGYLMSCGQTMLPCDGPMAEKLAACVAARGHTVLPGIIASGDQFIHTASEKERISRTFGAVCCEMEGAAIGQTCYMNQTPFLVIRAISDEADGEAPMDYPAFAAQAAQVSADAVREWIQSL